MISTRARIALHGLAYLAKADSNEPTSFPRMFEYLQTWSENLPLSRGYVGKIFQDLSKGGLVRSVPGRRGGYRMARAAAGITALDVVRAIDGVPTDECCLLADGSCGMTGSCGVVKILDDAQEAFLRVLRAQTIEAMARKMPWPGERKPDSRSAVRRR